MKPYVEIDARSKDTWPVLLGTDAGPTYLTQAEAETLKFELECALWQLEGREPETDHECT